MPLKVSDIGEKGLIKRILKKSNFNLSSNSFLDNLGIKSLTDDAALINLGDMYLTVTSDILFKSAHFPDEMTYIQMGEKVVTVNVSDLAAMGSKPIGIIISLGLPKDMSLDDFDNLIDGILKGCSKYGIMLIGGDTNEANELTISGTCLGFVRKDEVLMKNGANPGDIVAVTGPLGLAAAGFEILLNSEIEIKSLNEDYKEIILNHALNPEAKPEIGVLLAQSGYVTSATDITDGLASELGELVNSSSKGIGITIYEEKIPTKDFVIKIAQKAGKDPLEFILYYGEDFELLLTIREDKFDEIKEKFCLYEIGKVNKSGKIFMINKEGKKDLITPRGYEHLTK